MTELTVTERVRRWEEDRCSDCGCREDLILERVRAKLAAKPSKRGVQA